MLHLVYGTNSPLISASLVRHSLLHFHLSHMQGRLIQWARWAWAQGPQASGGPQTAHALFFYLVKKS